MNNDNDAKKVFVLGDLILDRTITVKVKGLSVEAHNCLTTEHLDTRETLGGAGNVAVGVKALGGEVEFLGARHDDMDGVALFGLLSASEIPYALESYERGRTTVKTRYRTTVKTRYRTPTGQLLRVDRDGAGTLPEYYWRDGTLSTILRDRLIAAQHRAVVCLVDYDKGFFANSCAGLMAILQHWLDDDQLILVDPGRSGDWRKYASPRTLFKANVAQAMAFRDSHSHNSPALAALPLPDFDVPAAARQAICETAQYNLNACCIEHAGLLITFGASGMGLLRGERYEDFPQQSVRVADTVGAGDTVMAALAVVLAEKGFGKDALTAACQMANLAARVSVQRFGCHAPTRKEVSDDWRSS